MVRSIEIKEVAPDGTIHLIETVSSGPSQIENGSELVCSLFLIAMIVLIGAEAIARNVFGTSLQVTDEIGGYLLVAMTFISMSVAEAHGAFHRVELIQARVGKKVRMISQIVFDLMSLGASALVTWQLTRLTLNSWRAEDAAADTALASAEHDGDRYGAALLRPAPNHYRQSEAPSREPSVMSPGVELVFVLAIFVGLLCVGMTIPFAIAVPSVLYLLLHAGLPGIKGIGLVSWGSMNSFTLSAIPLFILMAEILQESQLSLRVYHGLSKLVSWIPGGLLQTNIAGCAIFAAISGSSVVTAASIGRVALPELQKRNYSPRLSAGSLAAGGTLGILIPPSIAMIVYGTFTETSVAKLFLSLIHI